MQLLFNHLNEKKMKDLMLFAAAILPEADIVKEIKNNAEVFLATVDKEAKQKLHGYCSLLLTKELAAREGVEALSKEIDELHRIKDLIHSPLQ